MIKVLATSIVVYTAVVAGIILYYYGSGMAAGVILGGSTILASLGGLGLYWHFIFVKKPIAFVLSIIIFKYLILIGLLWCVYSFKWIDPIGFCIGLTALLFSLLVALVIKHYESRSR
jgi:hypothetical protein